MNNELITITNGEVSVNEAKGAQILFSSQYPFTKLDSTNPVSFQLITLFFNTEPPNPDGSSAVYNRTLIYSFPHGYNYVPSTWFLVTTDNFQTVLGPEGVLVAGGGDFPTVSSAQFIATADSQNINLYIDKYWIGSSGFSAPSVLGIFLSIRAYIFANDLSGTDVTSAQAT